jgi:hypothetical protein
VFLLAYFGGLALLLAGIASLGRVLYRSWWTTAALGFALALRHRIARTGVNTLEGYLHPRMLAFAIGVAAVATFLRGRTWLALALVGLAGLVHPTTALWFGIWLGAAALVSDARWRRVLWACAAVGAIIAGWAVWLGPLRGLLIPMDPAWVAVLAGKDYLFPGDWPFWAWAVNLGYPALIVALYAHRVGSGAASPREQGLVAGALSLFLILVVSLPLVAWRLAIAVQLQVSRILWMLDLVATAYLIWFLAESPVWKRRQTSPARAPMTVAALMAVLAFARGGYVTFSEHAGRPVIQRDLEAGEWRDVMSWVSHTPIGTHVLADPGHAWRYGTSVRVAGERDVFQEEVKDSAIALYSREVAVRVATRINDLGDFGGLTADRARALAEKYDLDLLVSERAFDLPAAYRNRRFTVYRLRAEPAS